jgi:putative two-component system response regulator
MAVVDVYDALTSDRPHRKKKTHEEALEIIRSGSGTHFDPGIVNSFLENEEIFRRIIRDEKNT